MNETLFGLSKIPFTALPSGGEVFIGPQPAGLVEALGSAFASRDAIAVVSGPAGTGKTTLVNYALDALYKQKKIVRVGRAPLKPQDIAESLLIILGVENRPTDREHRLVILRDALQQYETAGINVIIVVEDALTTGEEILAELAALTATDAGGARMVLMGADPLPDFLQRPELADLQERVTLQYSLNALSAAETRAYLLHCFRNAGGDFDQLFHSDCSALLHRICDGNPRAINHLAEVVLRAADELDLKQISARFTAGVAVQIYDPKSHDFRFVKQKAEIEAAATNQSSEPSHAVDADDKPTTVEANIAKAETLEDLDDVMAETLFGAELRELAAQATGGNN